MKSFKNFLIEKEDKVNRSIGDVKNQNELIKKYKKSSNVQPELFDTSKVGKEDPVKDVKTTRDITGNRKKIGRPVGSTNRKTNTTNTQTQLDLNKTNNKTSKPQSDLQKRMSNAANKNADLIKNKRGLETPKTPKVVKQSEVSKKIATKTIKIPKPKTTNITPEMKAKTFKQSFGKPTGADPKTGKATYIPPKNIVNRNLYTNPQGKVTERGIDNYISNRNTKGYFKGAKIDKETVNKGLEQTKKDIKDPKIRKSTADQIKTKYGGRRAERAITPDPWDDIPNMKTKTSTSKSRKSILNLRPPKGEIIGGPTGKPDRLSVPKTQNRKNLRATPSNPQGVPPDVMKQMKELGYDKPGSARKGYTGSFSSFKQRVKDNLAVQDIARKPIKTPGGGLVTAGQIKDTAIVKDAAKPKQITIGKPTRSPASKATKYPKRGKSFSTWSSRGFGKQTGTLFGVSTAINKYKEQRAKYPKKSKLSAATSAAAKGASSGFGSYAGAVIGRKYLGAPGMMLGSTLGSAVGSKGYEIANNLKNVASTTFKNFRKKSSPNKGFEKFTKSDAYKNTPTKTTPDGKKIKSFRISS